MHALRRPNGVKAVSRKFVGCHVTAQLVRLCSLNQQVPYHSSDSLAPLCGGWVAVQYSSHLGIVVAVLGKARIGLKDRLEAFSCTSRPVPYLLQLLEVACDLSFVPGEQDRFDIREVFVERRASDAGLLGDLRHCHRAQTAFANERRCDIQRRVANSAAMRLDRIVPKLGHVSNYM